MSAGRDVTERVPEERYIQLLGAATDAPEWALKLKRSRGGFLKNIDQFDAAAFHIAPREARVIDPQQRLLLETAWEALEDAGQDLRRLEGRLVGVYAGVWGSDYQARLFRDLPNVDIAMTTGGGRYAASGRLSYAFGFEGPSLTIDTACSSSLVAVHAACQALRAGECELALAGGANLILDPAITLAYLDAGVLSPDGRCKFGDAAADGYVRAEGVGILALKTVSRARADNDPIHAIIRASAVSHSGQTGGSLLAPGEAAQLRLFESALSEAGLVATDLDYIEAHGTGTRVGDRIELNALGTMLRRGRSTDSPPCLVGSVKTNIGHTESAAGVAGLIKAVLCLKHRKVPASLNFDTPNPEVPWSELPIEIPTATTSIGREGRPVFAGVNSFGITGTFAHVILEEALFDAVQSDGRALPPADAFHEAAAESLPRPPTIVPLSARSPAALAALAAAVGAQLRLAPDDLAGIGRSAALRRTHHEVRLCAVGRNAEDLTGILASFARNATDPNLYATTDAAAPMPTVGWVFSGQGPQWEGMGRQLYATEPSFRRKLDEIETLIQGETGLSIIAELNAKGSASHLDRTEIAQPAIFSIQVALAALLRSWGLQPALVVGHSVGEIAAAHVAGVLTLEAAVRVICARARIAEKAGGLGKMAAIEFDFDEAVALLKATDERLCVAAINGPRSLTISGPAEPLRDLCARLAAEGRFARLLDLNYPFHSPLLDPLLPEMTAVGAGLPVSAPGTPLYSTVFGRKAELADFAPDYWSRNLRETVLFAPAIEAMSSAGCDLFVEISPHPVLSSAIRQVLRTKRSAGDVVATLRRDGDEAADLRGCACAHFVKGLDLDWSALAPAAGRPIRLPTYPWQRESYWVDETPRNGGSRIWPNAIDDAPHPLLLRRMLMLGQGGACHWQSEISLARLPWLADHRVQGRPTFPAAAYIVAALKAAGELLPGAKLVDVTFHEALFLPTSGEVTLQLGLEPEEALDGYKVAIQAADVGRPAGARQHVTARAVPAAGVPARPSVSFDQPVGPVISSRDFYDAMRRAQLEYGASFQCVATLSVDGSKALASLKVPEFVQAQPANYDLHPAILDACLQTLVALTPGWLSASDLWLPQAIKEVSWRMAPSSGNDLTALAVTASPEREDFVGDVILLDPSGEAVFELKGVRLHKVARETSTSEILHEIRWDACPISAVEDGAIRRDHRDLVSEAAAVGPSSEEQAEIRRVSETANRLVGMSVANALRELGFPFTPGRRFAIADMIGKTGIAPSRERFLRRLLDILCEDGVLQSEGADWRVLTAPPDSDLAAELGAAAAQTALAPFWRIFTRASLNLSEALAGRADAIELLFGGEGASLMQDLYSTHLFWRAPMRQLAQAISSIGRQLPRGRMLRVLEIGAGTGGLTGHVLPRLPRARAQYVFTDRSDYFLSRARERFAGYPSLSERRLDIEQDPIAQGFAAGDFDVVLSANCLHATLDLGRTVEHAALLLKPGGLLLLQEETQRERWTDLIFGLTDGWWRFADVDRRPDHPLLSSRQWTALLGEKGFADVSVLGGDAEASCGAVAIIAQKRGAALPRAARASVTPWLILADQQGWGEMLAGRLRSLGQPCRLAQSGPPGDDGALTETVTAYFASADEPGQAIVDLRPLDVVIAEGEQAASFTKTVDQGTQRLLEVLKQSIACDRRHPPQLVLVTAGSQATGQDQGPAAAAQAALWAIARCAASEAPRAAIRAIDLDSVPAAGGITDLATELLVGGEPEIALRRGIRLARRLYRCDQPDNSRRRLPPGPFSMEIAGRGALDCFDAQPIVPSSPTGGDVQIRVAAAGLNFRDVLNLLGAVDGIPLGLECSGVVTAVGPDVTDVAVGDAVIATGHGAWRSHFTTAAALTAPRPPMLTHAEAAALPLAYLTAHYALRRLARLKRGQRLLIHSAAGGVGLAALHMALADGAEVIGTAGSPGKRDYLRALGAVQALDSRGLSFADDIRSTGSGQVDMVINALSGAFIPASLDLLAHGGIFIEIGKRDIWSSAEVAERRPDVTYHVIDLAEIMRHAPETLTPILRRLALEVAQGKLPRLPVRAFAMSEALGALRFMQEARHTGKIVLTLPADDALEQRLADTAAKTAGFLITGGLGGLGLVVAAWLAKNGARRLVLVGRGAPNQTALTQISSLRARGVEVFVEQCDVTDETRLAGLLARCGRDLPALKGVFHLAGVLDDELLHKLDSESFNTVFRPKALGGWNLHRLTEGMPLEVFVLFSSWTTLLGSPGQASHVAANAFLDALAHRRRAQGLPAQSINWGGWLEVGAAARPDRLDHLARQGIGAMTIKDALSALAQVMSGDMVQVAAGPFDPSAWRASAAAVGLLSSLRERPSIDGLQSGALSQREAFGSLRGAVAAAPPGIARRQILEKRIRERLAHILRTSTTSFDARLPFKSLGLDSLTALELRNGLELDTELKLSAAIIFNHPTIASLAKELEALLEPPSHNGIARRTEAAEVDDLSALMSALQDLPAEEALRLLATPVEIVDP